MTGGTPAVLTPVLAAVALPACSPAGSTPTAESSQAPSSPQSSSAPAAASSGSSRSSALPAAAQRYVDAVNSQSLDRLVSAFAPDGEVVDVSRRIRGRDAIRTWAASEVIGGSLRVDRVIRSGDRYRLRVRWAPAGSAGWAADYTFAVRDDQITVADLQYAS